MQAFVDNWPQYEHIICCRHLYNNLRKQHPSIMIRELFWKAVKATYAHEFERIMNEMKDSIKTSLRGSLSKHFLAIPISVRRPFGAWKAVRKGPISYWLMLWFIAESGKLKKK